MDSKLQQALYILEGYNGIFRQLWELSRIKFTTDVPTAGIAFDKKTGNELLFCFNPEFYDKLSVYELAFIIGHECLHVMLYHGKRYVAIKERELNKDLWNIAADIAIHEIMFREFGFKREYITIIDNMCTVETVFPDRINEIKRSQTMEYYFNELTKDKEIKYVPMDQHNFDEAFANGSDEAMKKAYERLTNVEKQELKDKLADIPKPSNKEQEAGDTPLGTVYDTPILEHTKKKWETVIKDWASTHLVSTRTDWTNKNRRFNSVKSKLKIPSYFTPEIKPVTVWMFLDTSGSCIDLAPRFLTAAASLPPKIFDARVFCFDTDIYEVNIREGKVIGGGGTAFDIIQEFIDKQGTHPDYVFVTTDGYGNQVKPKQPRKWKVYLTTDNKSCFPDTCEFHSFNEFE